MDNVGGLVAEVVVKVGTTLAVLVLTLLIRFVAKRQERRGSLLTSGVVTSSAAIVVVGVGDATDGHSTVRDWLWIVGWLAIGAVAAARL